MSIFTDGLDFFENNKNDIISGVTSLQTLLTTSGVTSQKQVTDFNQNITDQARNLENDISAHYVKNKTIKYLPYLLLAGVGVTIIISTFKGK